MSRTNTVVGIMAAALIGAKMIRNGDMHSDDVVMAEQDAPQPTDIVLDSSKGDELALSLLKALQDATAASQRGLWQWEVDNDGAST